MWSASQRDRSVSVTRSAVATFSVTRVTTSGWTGHASGSADQGPVTGLDSVSRTARRSGGTLMVPVNE